MFESFFKNKKLAVIYEQETIKLSTDHYFMGSSTSENEHL